MNTVGEYITHASSQLNDQRYGRAFTRWGRALLLDYLNLALAEIGTYRPEAFANSVVVTLVEGALQTIDGKTAVQTVYSNEDGSKIVPMDEDLSNAFSAYDINPPDIAFRNGMPQYKVRSAAVTQNNANMFIVDPPVPPGLSPKVNVWVDGITPKYDLTDWDNTLEVNSKYINTCLDFIMGKALALNADSVSSQQESEKYFTRFYTVMGVNYRQDAKFKSGYYLGQTGQGNRTS